MTAAPLARQRVLVTRPEQQQEALCHAIEEAGCIALRLPLLEIDSLVDAPDDRLLQQLQHLDSYSLLIFVSTNAAGYGAELIHSYWPQFPAAVRVLAIGPATAQCLEQQLCCPVAYSQAGMDSEAVLELPELRDLADKRIAIFRGRGGRELLADTLRERGARVDYFEVYERRPRQYDTDVIGELLESPGIDVVTVTSGESLRRLEKLAGHHIERLSLLPLLVPSARVAELARRAGFKQVFNAGSASPADFVSRLREIVVGADNTT